MNTIYLRFSDRSEALAALASVLGFTPAMDDSGAMLTTAGEVSGIRYDVAFLTDAGVSSDPGLVNVLWWGDALPNFGAAVVEPTSPSLYFAP